MGRLKGRERALKKCPRVMAPSRQDTEFLTTAAADVTGSEVLIKVLEMLSLRAERRIEQPRS
jgi:hypothetical protein